VVYDESHPHVMSIFFKSATLFMQFFFLWFINHVIGLITYMIISIQRIGCIKLVVSHDQSGGGL
jgi:hypothetical protein